QRGLRGRIFELQRIRHIGSAGWSLDIRSTPNYKHLKRSIVHTWVDGRMTLGTVMPDNQRHSGSPDTPDGLTESDLERVMRTVPLGAGVLAGGAVALLVLGWLIIYLFIFLPRGTVG